LRVLRAAGGHAPDPDGLSRPAHLQRAVGGHRDGHHDHPVRVLPVRGRHARRPDEPARGRLCDGLHPFPDRDPRRGAGGVLRDRIRVHPRHLQGGRRDHDPGRGRGDAAEPDAQPARAGGNHHFVHRAGGAGRPAARERGLPDHLRGRPDADAAHADVQPARLLAAPPVPGGLL
ncbi:MAG: Phosphate transport system permease protein PstC, partial [uncultured Ramlibacter sp.]